MTIAKTTIGNISLSVWNSYFTFLARFMGFFSHAINPIPSRSL